MNRYAESAISKPSKPTKRKSVINKYKKQSIMERKKITFDSFIRGVILGVIIIGILMLFKRLSGVLLPFFIAWLIAYLIYPLVTFFQYRLRLKNRVISIFCALFSILIVGGTAFYLLVPPMMDEFVRVKDLVIDYFSNGTHDGNVPKTLSEFLRENIDTQFVTQLFKEENMLNAIQQGVLTSSTKERLEALEKQRDDLKIAILQAELQKPKYTKEQIVSWIGQFKYGDVNSREYRKRIIDTFVNSLYLFDDRLVITYNFKGGTETITLKDVEAVYGSDLKAMSPPNKKAYA